MFTTEHYEKLAAWWKLRSEIIQHRPYSSAILGREELSENYESFCHMLADDNPRFDQRLFDLASGYDRVS